MVATALVAVTGAAFVIDQQVSDRQGNDGALVALDTPSPSASPTPRDTPAAEEVTQSCDAYGRTHDAVLHGDLVSDFEAGTLEVWDEKGIFLLRFDDSQCRAAHPLVDKILSNSESTHRQYEKQTCKTTMAQLEALDPAVLADPDASVSTPREGLKVKVSALIHLAHESCAVAGIKVPWTDPVAGDS